MSVTSQREAAVRAYMAVVVDALLTGDIGLRLLVRDPLEQPSDDPQAMPSIHRMEGFHRDESWYCRLIEPSAAQAVMADRAMAAAMEAWHRALPSLSPALLDLIDLARRKLPAPARDGPPTRWTEPAQRPPDRLDEVIDTLADLLVRMLSERATRRGA